MEETEKNVLNDLKEYREKISKLSEEELKQRDLYLKGLASGEIQGPLTYRPEIDKPHLKYYSDEEILSDLPKMLIYDYIKFCNKNRMDATALKYFNKKISYNDIYVNVDKIIKSLKSYGIKHGDVVTLCMPSIPETYYLFLSLNKMGVITNFVDPRINEERMEHCIANPNSQFNSKLVIVIDKYKSIVSNVSKKLGIENIVSISPANCLSPLAKLAYNKKNPLVKIDGVESWEDFIKRGKKYTSDVDYTYCENTPAAIEHTSGTTGIPKGAILSNDALVALCFQQKFVLPDMLPGDKFLNIMPPFLSYGLGCGLCAGLTSGVESTLIPNFAPENFVDLVLKHKPNHIIGVPSFLEQMLKDKRLEKEDLSFIKYYIAGGDRMVEELEIRINDFFEKHGVKHPVGKGYGMTELASAIATIKEDEINEIGSAGILMVKNNVKIVDLDSKKSQPYDKSGEIYVSGPTEMIGYTNEEENDNIIIIDDYGKRWIKTGDYGKVNPSGALVIENRLKRMIIRPDGHNVFPSSIENVILSHNAVDSCSVLGLKNEQYINGEIPTACVVLKEKYLGNEKEIEEELRQISLKKLPPRDVALDYKFIDFIPKKNTGKVDLEELKKIIEEKSSTIKF